MKIGVITFSNSKDNYGQILQCYALQMYLSNRGHSPFLIRYEDSPENEITGFKLRKILTYLTNLPTYIKWYLNRKREKADIEAYNNSANFEKRDFNGFLQRNIICTEVYNAASITSDPPMAEVYICGSDQIWGGEDAYYLSFAPDNTLKIAYAPSLGGLTSFPEEQISRMRNLIGRLDKIGMRELSGVEVCRSLGYDKAVQVVDPTLLLNFEDYNRIAIPPKKERYAFVYLLGNPIKVRVEDIFKRNEELGLKTVYVASQGRNDKFPKCDPTIEEWIGLIANAEFIVTNSFHCVVFALQFHRNFIAIPLSDGYERMNTRISELLASVGLSSRFTDNLNIHNNLSDKDFMRFDSYKSHQQVNSKNFLGL